MVVVDRVKHFEMEIFRNPHLKEYLENLTGKGDRLPEYYLQLQRAMETLEEFSILYPVFDQYFIHVIKLRSGRKKYLVIEPVLNPDTQAKYALVLEAFSKERAPLPRNAKGEEKDRVLNEFLLNATTTSRETRAKWLGRKLGLGPPPKIFLSREEKRSISHRLRRDTIGHGALTPVIDDPYLDEMRSAGGGRLDVLHKVWGEMETSLHFRDARELDAMLENEASHPGRGWEHWKTINFKTSRGATGVIQR